MPAFCDLPDAVRMEYRALIERNGGYVAGYYGPYVQVALPNPAGPFFAAMDAAGLELNERALHRFPLGSDCPPVSLRHGSSRGYWLFANYAPRSAT